MIESCFLHTCHKLLLSSSASKYVFSTDSAKLISWGTEIGDIRFATVLQFSKRWSSLSLSCRFWNSVSKFIWDQLRTSDTDRTCNTRRSERPRGSRWEKDTSAVPDKVYRKLNAWLYSVESGLQCCLYCAISDCRARAGWKVLTLASSHAQCESHVWPSYYTSALMLWWYIWEWIMRGSAGLRQKDKTSLEVSLKPWIFHPICCNTLKIMAVVKQLSVKSSVESKRSKYPMEPAISNLQFATNGNLHKSFVAPHLFFHPFDEIVICHNCEQYIRPERYAECLLITCFNVTMDLTVVMTILVTTRVPSPNTATVPPAPATALSIAICCLISPWS